ncbi:MAG: hypothetical protein WCN92_10840, partial [Eubacteriales bacterium]
MRKLFVILMSLFIITSLNVQAYALENTVFGSSAVKYFSNGFGGFADVLVRSIAGLMPSRDWPNMEGYVSDNLYPGTDGTVESHEWLCGFASESIIPDDINSGKYNSAGYFGNLPTNY